MKVEGIGVTAAVTPVESGNRRMPDESAGGQAKSQETRREPKEQEIDLKSVQGAVKLLNKTMETYNTELKFTMHEKSGEYIIKIVNTKDNSVVREIPPARVLDMVAYFKEVLGLIVDKFI